MNTPATCPRTKTPTLTAQENTNNNTPVKTEVLWSGGLWWGLWAGAPVFKQDQQIANADKSVSIDVHRWNL